AVARADAAVVGHVVEAVVRVRRRGDRTDLLAGRVLALHARHRLVDGMRLVAAARVVAVDADPVHLAAPDDALLADDRDVVLGLARDGAGGATRASGEIDRHPPLVARGDVRLVPERLELLGLDDVHLLDELGMSAELLERALADEILAALALPRNRAEEVRRLGELAG